MGRKLLKPEVDERCISLSNNISRVVELLLQERGLTKSRLARELNYAQSAMSGVFNPDSPERRWSFGLLIQVSEYLGVPLSAIIRAAESEYSEVSALPLLLIKTESCSKERLDLIVKLAAPDDVNGDARNILYSADMFKMAAPLYVGAYTIGLFGDEKVYEDLRRVAKACEGSSNSFWPSVKKALGPEEEG